MTASITPLFPDGVVTPLAFHRARRPSRERVDTKERPAEIVRLRTRQERAFDTYTAFLIAPYLAGLLALHMAELTRGILADKPR